MPGLLTILTNIPEIIGDVELALTTVEKVWPEAVEAEQAVLAAFKAPLEKFKADIEAMPAAGGGFGSIIQDVETFAGDLVAFGAAIEPLITLIENKAEGIWLDLQGPVTQIKNDVQDLLPATTTTVTGSTTGTAGSATS